MTAHPAWNLRARTCSQDGRVWNYLAYTFDGREHAIESPLPLTFSELERLIAESSYGVKAP